MIIKVFAPAQPLVLLTLLLLLLLPVGSGILTAAPALAETRYVAPRPEVVVRRGQGPDYKIIAMVDDGVAVELIEESQDYSRIRLEDGREGWVLKRFLSPEPPPTELIASLRAEREQLLQREKEVDENLASMSDSLARSEQELSAIIAERDQIKNDYEMLRQDTADVIKIKEGMQQTARENAQLAGQLESVAQENTRLTNDRTIHWFLAGGGVFLFGLLIGIIFRKSGKRKSSLL